jgi:hypothetical protein
MHDEGIHMSTDATLAKLIEGWLDGGLTHAEKTDLLHQLAVDPALRRRLAEQVAVLGATRAAADSNPRWLALFDLLENEQASAAGEASFEEMTMDRIGASHVPWWSRHPVAWGLAAALALLLAGAFLLKTPVSPVAAAPPEPVDVPAIAVVIGSSAESAFETGADLQPGVISQNEGWLTLQTFKGVSVTLHSPFEAVLINHDRVRLNIGMARVLVPDGAQGFKLESPAFDVVDLGTEFAAKVNADGTGTCRVFEGEADVSLLDSIGEVKHTKRLTSSKSVRITPASQGIRMIEEKDEDYPEIKLPPRAKLKLDPSYASHVMRMAPLGYWRFETVSNGLVPNEVSGGPRMQVAGTATVTAEEGGNHSGELTRRKQTEFFQIPNATDLLRDDFSLSLFAQFDWLQNFALLSAMRFDDEVQGHPFILQSYAAYRRTTQKGTSLHAVFRDPPGWDGGVEVHGSIMLRPLQWYHIAVTRSNGLITLYLDGEEIASESVGGMPLDCRRIFIGRLNGNSSQARMEARGLVGHIDELAIFPRALTDAEIRRIGLR